MAEKINPQRTRTDGEGPRTGGKFAPQLPDWLAYIYAPIIPILKKTIKIERSGPRDVNPQDILVPEGYEVDMVATGLNAPVHCCFDDYGYCYITESGHKIDAPPRIVQIDPRTGEQRTFWELPEDRWIKSGAVTGACWHQGNLYVMNTDTLSRINLDGSTTDIVTDLPGKGDHQANYPIAGPDGKLYFAVGVATNAGVVGADSFAFEWLSKFPDFCDIPGRDITLTGQNFEAQNVLDNILERVETSAYKPFGQACRPSEVIQGQVKCTGSVLRCNPDGSKLEMIAWGLRNPYGLAFTADGRLFATEHGMDERGARYILDDPDDFYEIRQGEWYGWPDYASGIRLDHPHWGDGGHNRQPVIADPPTSQPPRPLASFQTHTAANGFDFCKNPDFGFEGDAFVAMFGDLTPITSLTKLATPAGFKVMRVDMRSGQVADFAFNKIQGPAAILPHSGFERPSHCAFGPDGALYVVDFGEIKIAPERGGIRIKEQTGTLWRIRRMGGPQGQLPPEQIVIPAEAGLYAAALLVLAAGIGLGWWLNRAYRKRD